jgi:hypothetical protein
MSDIKLVGDIFNTIVSMVFTEENYKEYGDQLFDILEKAVKDSATTIDDVTVLPILIAARAAMGITDLPPTV